ncbi:biosynthetic arginine decarboxylase [Akkermansia sp. N21116]|jgi:arginine decarboxylase|uniref:biosynthetic arginine decarboxylase n=1 Tax=Akkermansia sp. N21116 TaxID=3040764 RepID=UPI00244E7B02|nr:biosynthetic arginine decarboxylase [Akkermansia sp. N21116]WPX41555.1 biosynthetic arginine decarboxylase [Akkermansia sp. N21116]
MGTRREGIKQKVRGWNHSDSAELYGIDDWGNGYFRVNKSGEVTVRLTDKDDSRKDVCLTDLVEGLAERGTTVPVLFRFRDLLRCRIKELNESFRNAIKEAKYQGKYQGVYPIKVNQQRQVIEEITEFGTCYDYGLEAGSKPELIAALSYMHNPNAYLICNGYKDDEFIDLALTAQKLGINIFIVLEMPSELEVILRRAEKLKIRPNLGIRVRLATKGSGLWQESAGDKSVFGLNTAQVIDSVDKLKKEGYLDCLKLLHFHQGSQIPNISVIREGLTEAARIYVDLVREGAPLEVLDMGGGLAVDYDGSKTNFHSSCNYSIAEFARDVVEVVGEVCNKYDVEHPTLVTESGRAVVAYYSVLVFNILDVTSAPGTDEPPAMPENASEMLKCLAETNRIISRKNLQECYNDACYYRDQLRAQFFYGNSTLRERGVGEAYYWHILKRISLMLTEMETIPEDLRELSCSMVDFYYGNFSLFQSLPDSWAIDQLFPVMPLQRLDERPTNKAVIADITCDCDGKIDHFIDREDVAKALPLHDVAPDENYYVGVFLVGAYQETLGDLHNLLGDTNVVGVHLEEGRPVYTHEVEGDTVADVLSYVEYDPKALIDKFRTLAENAVSSGRITPAERRKAMDVFRSGLNGYTYYEL